MTNKPSVCIIIPTYNQASYIVKAVESALSQDYSNRSILVADDNSNDTTKELLEPYIRDNKITYKKNEVNIGRVANYHKALYEYTNAEWVINLDGDDYYTNNQFISQAMQVIQHAGEANILFYQGSNIYKTENYEKALLPEMESLDKILNGSDYFFGYVRTQYFSHMSTLYKRVYAIESGFYEQDIISTDINSVLKLCLNINKQVIISKNISGVWLQHNSNASKTLKVREHWNNFKGYVYLYKLSLKKGFGKLKCLKWILHIGARYVYMYINSFKRK